MRGNWAIILHVYGFRSKGPRALPPALVQTNFYETTPGGVELNESTYDDIQVNNHEFYLKALIQTECTTCRLC